MPEQVEIDGQSALVSYLKNDWTPTEAGSEDFIKVIFDDGRVVFAFPSGETMTEEQADAISKQIDAIADSLGRMDFDPGEPRVPAGESGGGQWTGYSGSKGHGSLISTANPVGLGRSKAEKEAAAKRKGVYQQPSVAVMKLNPDLLRQNVGLFHNKQSYPYFRSDELKGNAEEVAKTIVSRMSDNLVWLAKQCSKEQFAAWRRWYDGAHQLAERDAKTFGIPTPAAAGVYAALSPQKAWEENVYLAHVVMETMAHKRDFRWDEAMTAKGGDLSVEGREGIWKIKDQPLLDKIRGKTLGELDNPNDPARLSKMAMWIRTYDEAHNDRHFGLFDPATGTISAQPMLTKAGKPLTARWQSIPAIANAIEAFQSNGDGRRLSEAMGGVHKVRSFYNNILDPHSPNDDVTVDTHAVGAALLFPSTQSMTPVYHALATRPEKSKVPVGYEPDKGSDVFGIYGTYGLYADAYRKAAKTLGVEPRELQSIVWMKKQELFGDQTGDLVVRAVDNVWRGYAKGDYDLAAARTKVIEAANENRPQ